MFSNSILRPQAFVLVPSVFTVADMADCPLVHISRLSYQRATLLK
jgi:hypothetical protein